MQPQGIVFNIQRFCSHDGPGIRTTVFLKGCPLRCYWCANPESQDKSPQLMVHDTRCAGCGECIRHCTDKAIDFSPGAGRKINFQSCSHCFECVQVCRYGSLLISGAFMYPEEVLKEVIKDNIFYKNSNGGVTISGGEPLSQPHFLKELLLLFKQNNLHVTLDTCGHAEKETLASLIPYTDLVLFDIKHLDSKKHKAYTGVANDCILKNLEYLSRKINIWLRIPLITGFNDQPDHIDAIGELACRLNIKKISLLPYHSGGQIKRQQIGENRTQNSFAPPDDDHINMLVNRLSACNIDVAVRR